MHVFNWQPTPLGIDSSLMFNCYFKPLALMNTSYIHNLAVPICTVLMCDIVESLDSISRDEPDAPLTQYITNAGISRVRYTITYFKHHHRVLQLISNRISV